MRQGRCLLPAGEAGRVLDRLLLLEQVIGPDGVQQALEDTACFDRRACFLTREVIFWVVLAMGIWTDLPIRQVFKAARRLRPGEATPHRSSLCVARQRLGLAPVRRLFQRTHAEVALLVKGIKHSGEQSMVRALLRCLCPEMLLLWDRGFFSYSLWKQTMATGCQVLARVTSRLVLRPRANLADGSYLAKLYPCESERNKDRNGIAVRVIRYRLNDPQRVGHGEEHVLITTLLDALRYPALELVCLYHERWEIELVYDEQKTHQDPRRPTKPAHVRSETPLGVLQEVYALSLGHFTVRAMMATAAATEQLDPDRLSFTGCLQILKCRLPECTARTRADLQVWYEVLMWEMCRERTDDAVRRNRLNPRVVRQKMSKFKKKRPEHSGLPPLQKRFIETVVMVH